MSASRQTPFSYPFSCPQGSDTIKLNIRSRWKRITSITVNIEDDNAGPILINIYVLIEGKKHQLGQPTAIYDGEGHNAKRFEWSEGKPLSLILPNQLVIEYTNLSGFDIETVTVSGVVER